MFSLCPRLRAPLTDGKPAAPPREVRVSGWIAVPREGSTRIVAVATTPTPAPSD